MISTIIYPIGYGKSLAGGGVDCLEMIGSFFFTCCVPPLQTNTDKIPNPRARPELRVILASSCYKKKQLRDSVDLHTGTKRERMPA